MRTGAILGSIGRKRISFALAGDDGALRGETIRSYSADTATGVSAALIGFRRDLALPNLPTRSAVSVPGLVRGDAISITRTRWFLSRSGLHAMLGEPPLILNDFAAEAWAFAGASARLQEVFGGSAAPNLRRGGCYLVVGITSGFGVAAVSRGAGGDMTVLATEAGHGQFAATTDELAAIVADLHPGRPAVAIEEIVSAPGLLAIYTLLSRRSGSPPRAKTPEEVTRLAATDPTARAACDMLAKAFWAQAGSLVMTFGAWDGVLVTGAVATALRPSLRDAAAQALFAGSIRYRRMLQDVPRALVTLDNCELIGLAEALRHERIAAVPVAAPMRAAPVARVAALQLPN